MNENTKRTGQKIKLQFEKSASALLYFSDITFISANPNKIVLPCNAESPKLTSLILDHAKRNCLTFAEYENFCKRGKGSLANIVEETQMFLRVGFGGNSPRLIFDINIRGKSGINSKMELITTAKPAQVNMVLNRFFNRRYTGLLPDFCEYFETKFISYKRKHLAPMYLPVQD